MNHDELPSPETQSSHQRSMEVVWRERARRLSLRPNLTRTAQDRPVVVLGIGKERYGIDLQDVAEVFPPIQPTPVPGAPQVFSGVINVYGEIRPVIDLRRLLGIHAAGTADLAGDLARVILLRRDAREIGLQIDSVEQIRWIGSADLSSSGRGDAVLSPYLKGSTKDLLMLLSTEAIFARLATGVAN
jgi:chemotaxis signal transduction protein